MIGDLSTLLAPISEQSFLDHFLEKKRLHVRSNDRMRAASLFPWSDINRLIQSDLLPADRFRVIRANVDLLPAMYRDGSATPRLRPQALQALLSQGASVVINGVGDLVPQIGRLSDAVERRLGCRVWVNAYLSFGRGSAFKPHWDGHDVLVLQIHGAKRWRSYGTPVPYPVAQHNAGTNPGSTVVWEDTLEPGDALYLPRGEAHSAALEGPNSVHLTIGIEALCGVDFVGWLAARAARDEVARMDLTRLGGDAALRAHEARFKERLHALLDETSIADYLAAEDAKRKPRPLLSLGLAEELDRDTVIVPTLRREMPLLADGEETRSVVIGDETHQLSAAERGLLDLLLVRQGFVFGDLVTALGDRFSESALREAVIDLAKQGLVALRPPGES